MPPVSPRRKQMWRCSGCNAGFSPLASSRRSGSGVRRVAIGHRWVPASVVTIDTLPGSRQSPFVETGPFDSPFQIRGQAIDWCICYPTSPAFLLSKTNPCNQGNPWLDRQSPGQVHFPVNVHSATKTGQFLPNSCPASLKPQV